METGLEAGRVEPHLGFARGRLGIGQREGYVQDFEGSWWAMCQLQDEVGMEETEDKFLREYAGEEPLARGVTFAIWGCRGGGYLAVDVSDTGIF